MKRQRQAQWGVGQTQRWDSRKKLKLSGLVGWSHEQVLAPGTCRLRTEFRGSTPDSLELESVCSGSRELPGLSA